MLRAALSYKARTERQAGRAEQQAGDLWGQVDQGRILDSWKLLSPVLLRTIMGAQADAGRSAGPYVDEALRAQDADNPVLGEINPAGLVGWASDGRDLSTLLLSPAFTAIDTLNRGATLAEAMGMGKVHARMIASTQVADAYRAAASVASTARMVTTYVRAVTPPSCSRCIILAGSDHAWDVEFKRHPRCKCTSVPVVSGQPRDDLITYPRDYFDSLSPAEQDRIFTVAGAQAIRDGADMARVVNARRKAAGLNGAAGQRGRLTADRYGRFLTAEVSLTNARGVRFERVMPETIYALARNHDEAIRMLKVYGYIY